MLVTNSQVMGLGQFVFYCKDCGWFCCFVVVPGTQSNQCRLDYNDSFT
jgi:hypothetical protein